MIIFTEEQDHSCLNKDLNEQTIEQILDQRDLHNSFDTFKQLGGIHEIIKKLKSDIHMGIDETNQEEVHLRKKFYSKKKKNQFQIIGFLEQIYNEAIQDKIVFLMMASLITKYSFNLVVFEKFWDIIHYFDLIIFMGIYLVQRIVQNYIQQYKLQHKEKVPYQEVSVIRNSVIKQISIKDLLIGDILPLNEGLIIPIDGIIVKGSNNYSLIFVLVFYE